MIKLEGTGYRKERIGENISQHEDNTQSTNKGLLLVVIANMETEFEE